MEYQIAVLVIIAVSRLYLSCSGQSFSLQPKDCLKLKGNDVTFTCQASGLVGPSYYWLKNGVNVTRGTADINNLKASLTIKSLTFLDAGRYACSATSNTNTITSNTARLIIQGSPELTQPPLPLTSHEGYTVQFTCGAVANPQPKVIWYHNSRQISEGGRFSIYANGTLVINTLTKADAGKYSCKVKNSFGEDGAFADLTVLDPPSPPKFTTAPSNASATEGGVVVFYCQATGSPSPTISWRPVGNYSIPSDRRSQPRPGALGISKLKPSDDGLYACVAKNSQGEKVAYVYLNIKGFPRFILSPTNQVVKEKNSISFSCSANSDPKPKISWQLPNGVIVSQDKSSGNLEVFMNNTLSIRVVNEKDQGTYTCIAGNSVGTRQATATLSVLTVPRFTANLQNITRTRGQDVIFTCPARANPTPTFYWLYKDSIIRRNQQIRLVSVNTSNEGTYTCRANNTIGSASEAFYLRIIIVPVITLKPSNQTIGIGGIAKFSCQSSGDPAPSITWYKGGTRVQEGPRYSILANSTLVIANATEGDKGWFTCRASNPAGKSEGVAYLFVTDSPTFTSLPRNLTVDIGKMARLTCRAIAKDTPHITWFKFDQSGRRLQVAAANVLVSGDLQIISVKRSDRAQYACRACNAAGCVTAAKVMLNVLYYPSFLVPPKSVGVLQGQDALLKCEPDASPKAVITWRRPDGEIFGGKEYQQIITNVQPSKTGDYQCEGSNYLGDAGPVKITLSIQTKAVITDITREKSSVTETITCVVIGTPLPQVAWYVGKDLLPRNAQYPNFIVTADKKLQIPVGTLNKENFLCNATNDQNSDVYLVKAPVAPTSLSATEVTSSSIKVTWLRPSPPQYLVTHYLLEKWSMDTSWELVSDNIKELSYKVSHLTGYTIYRFRIQGINGLGASNFTTTSGNVSTLSSSPSPPRYVSAYVISSSKINVTWSAPLYLNGPLNGVKYRLMYYPKLPNFTNDFNISHDDSKNLQRLSVSGLDADVKYSIVVYAWRRRRQDDMILMSVGVSSSARTLQIVPSSPPISLVIVANGPYQIIAKWKKPPYSIRGYNILFMENDPEGNYTKVNIANGAATSYVLMDLKENMVYLVKVQMYSNVNDQGPFSDVVEIRTAVDEFGSIAGQSQGQSRSISWQVAVGGLVCGIVLIIVVSVTVWCWWKRTRQTNHTFQISTRRRRAPSSTLSSGSVEGQYNIGAFNPELDMDLDLEMFSNAGNVVPISTSFSNERAIAYLDPAVINSSTDVNLHQNDDIINENVPTNAVSKQAPTYAKVDMSKKKKSKQRTDVNSHQTDDNIYENDVSQGKPAGSSNNLNVPTNGLSKQAPTYAKVDMSKKKKSKERSGQKQQVSNQAPSYAELEIHAKTESNQPTKGSTVVSNQAPSYAELEISTKTESNQPTKDSTIVSNQVPSYAQVDTCRTSSPVDEIPPLDNVPEAKESAEGMLVKEKFNKISDNSPELQYPDYDSDISDVPFPDEELPKLERTWTNVSEFNFPPPPTDPPPVEPQGGRTDNSPDIVPISDNPVIKTASDDSAVGDGNGIKKRRMVASWADNDNEPMGNLWEAVDKELDRRLGTT